MSETLGELQEWLRIHPDVTIHVTVHKLGYTVALDSLRGAPVYGMATSKTLSDAMKSAILQCEKRLQPLRLP